ncbi:MAG: RdgB/HAM1 family non-canonical purine NTP pyrophosphatase [Planctomycetes bacterium]|nr:RdgB/HAM1 family non-canonical purine NTP pyrophosphatase [Planctomycetota bacterium]
MAIVLASRNPKKARELDRIVRDAGLDVRFLSLELYPDVPTAPEDEATFAGNARAKALWYARATDQLCLADDSGLEVDALGGAPGVHSARFAGAGASDAANRAHLLAGLKDVPAERRTARFRCALALADAEQVIFEAAGTAEGVILAAEQGAGGFGYDPLFRSTELGRTFAEVDSAEKDRVSHRGRALARLVAFLRDTPPG